MREKLLTSEQRLRTLINSTPDIICFKDAKGRWLEANDADLKIFSLTDVDYRGKTDSELADFTDPIYRHAFLTCEASDETAWQANGISRKEEVIPQPDGSQKKYDVIKVPIFNTDGSRKGLVVLGRDITERKLAEEELQKMAKLKSVGILAGGIAHDFNNILMGLFGNISIAKLELSEDHPAFKFLSKAEKSMDRATRLTNQLLTFAKGGEPVRKNVPLGTLVRDIVRFDLSGSNVKPIFKLANSLWLADVDKGQMQQVFSNLTINADQAMPDGGHLYITMENEDLSRKSLPGLKPGKYLKVTVKDEGTGIDPKQLGRIFDPYFTTKQAGSGLGLATTYSIINKHGGHIGVESTLGKGTVFTLYLPASEARQLPEARKPVTKLLPAQRTKVLVMDDEEMIRDIASQMLKKKGYEVQTAEHGEQAIEMYSQALNSSEPFDAVIMDLTISGGMGGEEAMKKILALDPEARGIVSSGYANDRIMANHTEYGFKDIVSKPYKIDQLREVLNRVLGK